MPVEFGSALAGLRSVSTSRNVASRITVIEDPENPERGIYFGEQGTVRSGLQGLRGQDQIGPPVCGRRSA